MGPSIVDNPGCKTVIYYNGSMTTAPIVKPKKGGGQADTTLHLLLFQSRCPLLFYLHAACRPARFSDHRSELLRLRSPARVSLASPGSLPRSLFYHVLVHHRAPTPTDMPKRGRSVWFFPRPSKREDEELGPLRHISVNYDVLESLFHLNLKDAARKLP